MGSAPDLSQRHAVLQPLSRYVCCCRTQTRRQNPCVDRPQAGSSCYSRTVCLSVLDTVLFGIIKSARALRTTHRCFLLQDCCLDSLCRRRSLCRAEYWQMRWVWVSPSCGPVGLPFHVPYSWRLPHAISVYMVAPSIGPGFARVHARTHRKPLQCEPCHVICHPPGKTVETIALILTRPPPTRPLPLTTTTNCSHEQATKPAGSSDWIYAQVFTTCMMCTTVL